MRLQTYVERVAKDDDTDEEGTSVNVRHDALSSIPDVRTIFDAFLT